MTSGLYFLAFDLALACFLCFRKWLCWHSDPHVTIDVP
jgi:hypothetical protein